MLRSILLLSLFFMFFCTVFGQKCTDKFVKNISSGGIHVIETNFVTFIYRTEFNYAFKLINSSEGITAEFVLSGYSENDINPMNMDDKIMFVTSGGEKKLFDFIQDNTL